MDRFFQLATQRYYYGAAITLMLLSCIALCPAQGLQSPVPNPVQAAFFVILRKDLNQPVRFLKVKYFIEAGPEFSAYPPMATPALSSRIGIGGYLEAQKDAWTLGIGASGALNFTLNPLIYKNALHQMDLLLAIMPEAGAYIGRKLNSGLIMEIRGSCVMPWYASLLRYESFSRYVCIRMSASVVVPLKGGPGK